MQNTTIPMPSQPINESVIYVPSQEVDTSAEKYVYTGPTYTTFNSSAHFGQTPPKLFVRNSYGLYGHITYLFTEEGFIDWRKMIPKNFLVPNKEKVKETPENIDQLEEDELIILLGGLKYLAQLRGFSSVEYKVVSASEEYAAVNCKISWLPNYETEYKPITFESVAGVNLRNVRDFARFYLLEMAENRSFARCVRNFLKINIVSDKELGEEKMNIESKIDDEKINKQRLDILEKLEKVMIKKKLNFDDIKKRIESDGLMSITNLQTINDVPTSILTDLVYRINSKQKKVEA